VSSKASTKGGKKRKRTKERNHPSSCDRYRLFDLISDRSIYYHRSKVIARDVATPPSPKRGNNARREFLRRARHTSDRCMDYLLAFQARSFALRGGEIRKFRAEGGVTPAVTCPKVSSGLSVDEPVLMKRTSSRLTEKRILARDRHHPRSSRQYHRDTLVPVPIFRGKNAENW